MKIIAVDSFNRDTESDSLICENISEYYGNQILNFLNSKYLGDESPVFFRLVKDAHKLHIYDPNK